MCSGSGNHVPPAKSQFMFKFAGQYNSLRKLCTIIRFKTMFMLRRLFHLIELQVMILHCIPTGALLSTLLGLSTKAIIWLDMQARACSCCSCGCRGFDETPYTAASCISHIWSTSCSVTSTCCAQPNPATVGQAHLTAACCQRLHIQPHHMCALVLVIAGGNMRPLL